MARAYSPSAKASTPSTRRRRMNCPTVFGVTRNGGVGERFRAPQFARFLETERILTQYVAVVFALRVPMWQDSCNGIADAERLTEADVSIVSEAHGQRIGRMIDEDRFPDIHRVGESARGQRFDGGEMAGLAGGCTGAGAGAGMFGRAESCGDARMVGAKSAQQKQRSDRAAAQTEVGILIHRVLQAANRISLPAEVVRDGVVERLRGFVRSCYPKALGVRSHQKASGVGACRILSPAATEPLTGRMAPGRRRFRSTLSEPVMECG